MNVREPASTAPIGQPNPFDRSSQTLGGALRQSGILAAAGLYALDHNVERLAKDHANARRLGDMLGNIPGIRLMNPEIETNIIFIDPSPGGKKPDQIVSRLLTHGVRMGTSYGALIRAVTHLEITKKDVELVATREEMPRALAMHLLSGPRPFAHRQPRPPSLPSAFPNKDAWKCRSTGR